MGFREEDHARRKIAKTPAISREDTKGTGSRTSQA